MAIDKQIDRYIRRQIDGKQIHYIYTNRQIYKKIDRWQIDTYIAKQIDRYIRRQIDGKQIHYIYTNRQIYKKIDGKQIHIYR